MLWVKSLHIVLVASWFAGLFYLPRIFVNLAMVALDSTAERSRLLLMGAKLFRFTAMLSWLALGSGFWMWWLLSGVPGFGFGPGNGWLHAKLLVVVLVLAYQHVCGVTLRRFNAGGNRRSHVWYRWFNEIPIVLLLAAVTLVVVKPF